MTLTNKVWQLHKVTDLEMVCSYLRWQSHWSFNMHIEKIKVFSLWNITYSPSYGKLCTCPCINFILFLFDIHWYSICVDYYNLRAGRGLRSAGWETLRACKELGFTSVSGWSKSPSHSCGLKSVAFLHTARGGSWCGRRREAPSPVLLLSDPLPSSRHRTGKNSRVWTYFHRLDWLPAVITSWSSKWRIAPLCWLFFGIHIVLTYGQVKNPFIFISEHSDMQVELEWVFRGVDWIRTRAPFQSHKQHFHWGVGKGCWPWDYV